MISYEEFESNCREIQERILRACQASGRSADSVALLPVTKTHPIQAVEYSERFGMRAVGENRVQEAIEKQNTGSFSVNWELIGHLQSNKAKVAVEHFSRIQSVDSEKLLLKLDSAAQQIGKIQRILLQVNAGDDPAKFGVSRSGITPLFEKSRGLTNIEVEGLMTIAPLSDDRSVAARTFERLCDIRNGLEDQFAVKLPELSMGMTGDLEAAIAAGSTQIRIGTALFGQRPRR